jgi:hypothetical protein
MKQLKLLILSAITLATVGCASITGSTSQNVSVQAKEPSGVEVVGASCELSNKRGKWFVTTPGSVGVSKSNDDMQVICTKENDSPVRNAIVSETKGSMYGNIIFGGGIGAVVDHNSGAAYEYPALIQMLMSKLAMSDAGGGQTTVATQSGTSNTAVSGQTAEQKLVELKLLFDQKLISQDVYVEQQRKVLGQ